MSKHRTGIFSGCNKTSVVVDPSTGKIVATIQNGTRIDALGWDASKRLIYIPNGGEGNVTVVHQDSSDKYTTVATVDTFAGAKTITVDPTTHNVHLSIPARASPPQASPCSLHEYAVYSLAIHVRQPKRTALIFVGQLLVVHAEAAQDGRLQIVHVHRVGDRVVAIVVRFTEGEAAFEELNRS